MSIKRFLTTLFLFVAILLPELAFAVTEKEMEQARVIATKAYLRYANNGSGYLDELNPKTMEELEKSLKPREKQNLKAFKAIKNPADYKSWDKQKLIDFWSVTAFQTKGLIESGKMGSSRTKKQIEKMSIAAASKSTAETTKKVEAPKAAETKAEPKTEAKAEQQTPTPETQPKPAETVSEQPKDAAVELNPDNLIDPILNAEQLSANPDLVGDDELFDDGAEVEKVKNYTWVYIMCLAILIGIAIALVVFASNVMKRNGDNKRQEDLDNLSPDDIHEVEALKEKFNQILAEKDSEIKVLAKKLENVNRQNAEYKTNLENLTAEIAVLRNREKAHTAEISAQETANREKTVVETPREMPRETREHQPKHEAKSTETVAARPLHERRQDNRQIRRIYLGRANSKGIFIRADRNLNPGNTIYCLDTSDGYSGSFRVANDPSVWRLVSQNPKEFLGYACNCNDIEDTEDYSRIITESAGTAIFEGGCWKVIRKAKIRYE